MAEDVEYWTCARQLERLNAEKAELRAALQGLVWFARQELREGCNCERCKSIRAAQDVLEGIHE